MKFEPKNKENEFCSNAWRANVKKMLLI